MTRSVVIGLAALGVFAGGPAAAQLAVGPPPAVVQVQTDQPPPVEAPADDLNATAQEPGGTELGLPLREPPPRTLRAYWHVFIAFAVTWLLLFGYSVTVGRRFGRLEEELRRLRS